MTGEGVEARDEAEGGIGHLCAVREEAEAVRTAVRESAEADEPLHSSTVTHPAVASPSGCDASIPLVRGCALPAPGSLEARPGGIGWLPPGDHASPAGRGVAADRTIRSDSADGHRFERRPRRAHYSQKSRAAQPTVELTWECSQYSVVGLVSAAIRFRGI